MSGTAILLLVYVFKALTGTILPPPHSPSVCSCKLPVATVPKFPSGSRSTRRNMNFQPTSKMRVFSNNRNAKKLAPVFCWFEDTFVFFQKFPHRTEYESVSPRIL